MEARICVYCQEKIGEISPFLYGGGFEHLGGAVDRGLDAQMLEGTSFEEEDINQDGISDKWLPLGWGTHTVRYSRAGRNAFHADYAQKIEILSYTNGERGIKQGGLSIVKGQRYLASLYLMQEGLGGTTVRVYLGRGDKVYARETIDQITSEWRKYTLSLTPDVSRAEVEFRITCAGKGTLWIDQVSLIPEDTYQGHGTRRDIMKQIIALNPTLIRWPGGWFAEAYHWQDGIGDSARRPVRRKYCSSVRMKNNPSWESNRFGTDEFIQCCRDLGAVPLLVVNIGYEEGSALEEYLEEAAQWVEYCNGDRTTPFGALRAANGHPEPYRVRRWEIGNEPWEMGPEDYGRRFIRFARIMKEKDPSIKLVAAGGYGYDKSWNQKVLKIAGGYMDYLDLHYYYSSEDYFETMAEPLNYEKFLEDLKKEISSLVPGRKIRVSILEWNSNTHWKDAGRLKGGLYAASFLNMLERQGDLVEQSIPWPLLRRVQPPGNHLSDHGLIWYDNHRVYLSPTALAFQLYRRHYAPQRVRCIVQCDTFDSGRRSRIPYLDGVATRDRERRILILSVVNKDPEKGIRTRIDLEDMPVEKMELETPVSTLTGPNINAKNSLDNPGKVQIVNAIFAGVSKRFGYTFPAHSVTVFRFQWYSSR